MGKKKIAVLGSEDETRIKAKKAVKLSQKKIREGKTAKAPGLAGGQRVVDTSTESLVEYEKMQEKLKAVEGEPMKAAGKRQRVRSKSYKEAKNKVDASKSYSLDRGLELLHRVSLTKFDPAVELHITFKEKGAWGREIDLPHGNGKARRVAIATDEVIAQIEKGRTDFDLLLATPAQMPKLIKLAKILGPKGLMPNPKNGTIINNPEALAKEMAAKNSLSLKTEKDAAVMHLTIGKLSFPDKNLVENINAVGAGLAGKQIRKVVLKSTMSPAIKVAI